MAGISAVIIAYNEEKYIGRCLSSIREVADEIIVVDSFSTDSTEAICRENNVSFIRHAFEGYVEQKNYAMSFAKNPLVLFLDADEALSDELKESILGVKENPLFDGYRFNRRHNYCGRWIGHSRWYPDRQLRLFNPAGGKWVGPNPHDRFMMNSGTRTGWLRGDLLHWNYDSFEDHVDKMNRFSSIAAGEYFRAGRKAGIFTGLMHMSWSFFRSYILWAGFLDGFKGFMGCSITAWSSFLKYSKLRKLMMENKRSSAGK